MKIQAFSWRPWVALANLVGLLCSTPVQAQESVAPWISGLPGLEHPAAWSLGTASVTAGAQTESRWAHHGEPLSSFWFGAQWRPELKGKGGRSSERNNWSFGAKTSLEDQASGWKHGHHTLHGALAIPLNRQWQGAAGIGLGVSHWVLDGRPWSWDAQYGPGGYNATAPTGEPESLVVGGSVQPEVSVSLAAERRVQMRSSQPQYKGAVTLRHLIRNPSPHFLIQHADTTSRHLAWWMEGSSDLGLEDLRWRAWHRGAWQGSAKIMEWGAALSRTFGTASRFTREEMSHDIEWGVLVRTDGLIRLPLLWKHAGLACWIAPGFSLQSASAVSSPWAASVLWSPSGQSVTRVR